MWRCSISSELARLDAEIVACRRCLRLVEWRERIAREKRPAFSDWSYWGKPVPNFGDPQATRLIVGLAPAAHGANRTGRMFTGDRSGDWLYRALFRAGVASQPTSEHADDGLALRGVLITAVCHCAPPQNKPTPEEVARCSDYLTRLLQDRPWKAILCLGKLAWDQAHRAEGWRAAPFGHGASVRHGDCLWVASYHPSQQNTFTGKLTEAMFYQSICTFLAEGP
jgi:uracil-DNA glycosylase family 4